MTKASIVSRFQPGMRVRVTNHFITRPDHVCYGTKDRVVTKVNNSAIHFSVGGRVQWPKASEVVSDGSPFIKLYGFPKPGDLFLTLEIEG